MLNFLEIPPVFRRKFALSGGKIPRHPACFKILNRLLGRNIIEIGYYVESYFPRNNIRLISISDQIEILDEMSNMHKQSFIFEPNNYMDQLRNVIVLLRYAVGKVDMQIERQRFLIESLRSSVEKEIINPAESEELHLTFMSKQTELMKLHDLLQEDIRRVMINP